MARPCSTCSHPKRQEIDIRLLGGERKEALASRYGISRSSLYRHAGKCLRTSLIQDLRATEEVGAVDLIEALANTLADVQAVRSAAVLAGRGAEVVNAATAVVRTVSVLFDRLGVDSDDVVAPLREADALGRAVVDVIALWPDVGPRLAAALRRHGATELADAVQVRTDAALTAQEGATR